MALKPCKECGKSISTSAASCPDCGAPNKQSSSFRIGCAGWILLIFLVVFFAGLMDSPSTTSHESPAVPQKTAEQKAQDAKREAEREGIFWKNSIEQDAMSQKEIKWSIIRSINQVSFEFPYQGLQRANLGIRKHPRYGLDVILWLDKAHFLCSSIDGCTVKVRFDDAQPVSFRADPPGDHSTTTLFIGSEQKFIEKLKKSKRTMIEASFYQAGNHVMAFETEGLQLQ